MKFSLADALKKLGRETLEFVQFIFTVLILFFVIRTFIGQPFIVDGSSMSPNFETGQFLIVDKLTYHIFEPQRGDVVVFRYTKNQKKVETSNPLLSMITPNTYFIKRLIALPGEHITVANGKTFITHLDGTRSEYEEGYVVYKDGMKSSDMTLKDDEYFVMGDNRAESYDSRSWGPVKRSEIEGRAFVRMYPFNSFGLFPASVKQYSI